MEVIKGIEFYEINPDEQHKKRIHSLFIPLRL